jgi:hypothetical protein
MSLEEADLPASQFSLGGIMPWIPAGATRSLGLFLAYATAFIGDKLGVLT